MKMKMKFKLRSSTIIALMLVASACGPNQKEAVESNKLASLSIGKLEASGASSPWTSLIVKLEQVAPKTGTIEKTFLKSSFDQGQKM